MAPIQNITTYCASMAHGLDHKLFFLDLLPKLGALLDWGCADGQLLKEAVERGVWSITAWDSDPAMQDAAVKTLAGKDHAFVAADEETALRAMTFDADVLGNTAVLFSSVLHEMYTHQPEQMEAHWQRVAATGVDYIIVRDMFWQSDDEFSLTLGEQAIEAVKGMGGLEQARDHIARAGHGLYFTKSLTHFLLKYPYKENWVRENAEDYFSLPDLRPILAPLGYEPIHWNHHCPEFIKARIKADTQIELPFATHLTAVFQRKPTP